jgi:7-cyano-7-deazaguanine synthase
MNQFENYELRIKSYHLKLLSVAAAFRLRKKIIHNLKREKAIILVSGGMDSLVTAAIAAGQYDLAFLHLNYGQKTEKRELKAFNDIADHFKIVDKYRMIISIEHLSKIGGSSLTDPLIEVSKSDLGSKEIPDTYVPFRNANILSIAVSWAEVTGAKKIFIGAVEEDSSGYPDCREVFYDAFNKTIELGTKTGTKITVVTPIIHLKKHEIVKKGIELNAPFQLSWSCYKNNDKACGECDSCVLRLRGFELAGFRDPIVYENNSILK